MMKKLVPILAVLLVISSCGKNEQQAPSQGPAPFPVQTVNTQDATVYQEYTARIEGQQNVEIRSKVSGFIEKIYVDEGQVVKKGQILFKLVTQTLNQDGSAAKAMVQAAQGEVDRLKPLVERQIISNVQLETAKAKFFEARENYKTFFKENPQATMKNMVFGELNKYESYLLERKHLNHHFEQFGIL